MRSYNKWAGKYPPGSPAGWRADGHVTCNISCLNGDCKQVVDVRLETLPEDQPWSEVGWRLVCSKCGCAGAVTIVPNWDDRGPFAKVWRVSRSSSS